MNRTNLLVALLFAVGGCAGNDSSSDDLSSLAVEGGKADAVLPSGAWEIDASNLQADDIAYVNLLANGSFVWARCFDTPCSQLVPQDGSWQAYRSTTGRRYLEFFMGAHTDANAPPPSPKTVKPTTPAPAPKGQIAFVYAYSLRGKTLKLRRANTTRWFSTVAFSDEAACNESSGTWDGTKCACTDHNDPTILFQPGLGGCFQAPAWSEDACDSTGGSYTDDDINLVGSFCDCGAGWYYQQSGGCVPVPQ